MKWSCNGMAAHKIAHATLKGPSVVKEILIGLSLGLMAGGLWKMHHWNEQRKTRSFYDMLEKGTISMNLYLPYISVISVNLEPLALVEKKEEAGRG
ncbi:Cytochrome c oxidase subunit 5C [Nymphaea thermarum]|nr:Cytochrome c oxidase subunit 5C [Nymphaea thermarum]